MNLLSIQQETSTQRVQPRVRRPIGIDFEKFRQNYSVHPSTESQTLSPRFESSGYDNYIAQSLKKLCDTQTQDSFAQKLKRQTSPVATPEISLRTHVNRRSN